MVKVNNWNAEYDVVVLGFGGAGATAARFAADEGGPPYGYDRPV